MLGMIEPTVPPMPELKKKERYMFKKVRETLDKFEDIVTRENGEYTEEEEDFIRDFDLYFATALRKDYPGTGNLGKILVIMGKQ